jgi:hypothetical protein
MEAPRTSTSMETIATAMVAHKGAMEDLTTSAATIMVTILHPRSLRLTGIETLKPSG